MTQPSTMTPITDENYISIASKETLPTILVRWEQERLISALDRHFALAMADMHQESSQLFLLICVLLSKQLSAQHTCLLLNHIDLANPMQEQTPSCSIKLTHDQLIQTLEQFTAISSVYHPLKGLNSQSDDEDSNDGLVKPTTNNVSTPIVLSSGRLYLHRYYHYECEVANKLLNLAQSTTSCSIQSQEIASAKIDLAMLFDQTDDLNKDIEIDWQKMAVATSLTQDLAVITGGPGTGKTTTVTKLLYLLMKQGSPVVRLVAPTGKAAARLSESIKASKQRLADAFSDVKTNNTFSVDSLSRIPEQASTIHRLLGVIPNSHKFRHHSDNPLRLDVLIVDEASMVDLPMMYKLLSALPLHSRLILLGDQDQLASVEAGAVLADICQGLTAAENLNSNGLQWQMRYSPKMAKQLTELTGYSLQQLVDSNAGIGDSLCMLQKSHRFSDDAGIGQLAVAVNAADKQAISQVWQTGYKELIWLDHQIVKQTQTPASSVSTLSSMNNLGLANLLEQAVSAYAVYLQLLKDTSVPVEDIIDCYNRYRLLCAMRMGEYGVEGINNSVIQALTDKGLIQPKQEFYLGRPIIVQSNDYNLELFNGDIGLILYDQTETNEQVPARLMAHFVKADGSILKVLPARLPRHDTCFAMTVHKSQGSEFEQVALVLPLKPSNSQRQLLTKELIYTAITRAKAQFTCLGTPIIFEQACLRATQRASGLAQKLWPKN